MKQKGMYEEMFLGFLYILILSDNADPSFKFAGIVKNIYILLMALFIFFDFKEFNPLLKIHKAFMPFIIFAFFCLLYSPVVIVGVQKTISYLFVLIVIPNYFYKCYKENGITFIKNIVYFVLTLLFIGLCFLVVNSEYVYIESGRFRGIFGNPNGLGLFCFVFFAFFFILNKLSPELFEKKEKIVGYLIIIVSILLSNSRNAYISIILLVLFTRLYELPTSLGLIVTIVLLVFGYYLMDKLPIIIVQLGLENFFRLNTLQELSGRAVAWHFAWNQIQDNFFMGLGFGYDEYVMRSNFRVLSKLGHQGGVHNSYLSLWINFGLIGLLIYIRSFLLIFIKAVKITNLALPVFFAVIFSSSFEGLLVGSLNPHMFFLLIIITILSEGFLNKEDEPVEEEAQYIPSNI
jgi:O-antigen ligase